MNILYTIYQWYIFLYANHPLYVCKHFFNGKNKKPLTEKNKTQPTNFYGKSKLDGEKFIINSKCKYFILRISWLYSERKRNFPQKVIKKIMNLSNVNKEKALSSSTIF